MKTQLINVLEGIVEPSENEYGDDQPVLYWVNLIPHYDKTTTIIVGECGNKTTKIRIQFDYISKSDTVVVLSEYRNRLCSPDVYEKYYNTIKYQDPIHDTRLFLPWIEITNKTGICVPLLIEKIFNRIPDKILFL
jgi:hypothetical protein